MEEPVPTAAHDVPPSWRQEPRGHPDDVQARRIRKKTWTLLALLAVAVGALLGLASTFRSCPFPAFLPIVVGGFQEPGGAMAFADADLAALARRGLFARTIGDPTPIGPTESIARRLDRLGDVSARESLVVYLEAPARVGSEGVVEVLGARTGVDEPDRWIPLREIFARVAACPARNRLVLLDVMRPIADPIEGILADDVAARMEQTVAAAAPAGQELFVLSACGAGQQSWTSEELGRSVFGLAVEEGLLGRADAEGGNGDGRVTVRELARYVSRRTQAWTWHNRGSRQTPVLLEHGVSGNRPADFALAPRNRLEMVARHEALEPEARMYPDWLKAAWERRDGLVADGSAGLLPRALRRLNTTMLAAERAWRAGGDPTRVQAWLESDSTELVRQFARLRTEPRLPVRSLALAEIQGQVPDPAVGVAMSELLVKRSRSAIGLKPEEATAAQAKLLADFQAATQAKPGFDVARAVFAAAVETTVPEPQGILFLDGLLRLRQPMPEWVETLTLRRLADRAETMVQGKAPAGAWKPASVRKLLNVVSQGERAHARAGSPGWLQPWLDAAAEARHLGEVAFDAVGYVPSDKADGHLERALTLYEAVIAAQDRYHSAVRLRDAALEVLPDFLPYLDHAPELFQAWSDASHAADDLDAALAAPPPEIPSATKPGAMIQTPGLEVLRASSDRINRLAAKLESPLARLKAPFQRDAVAGLLARAKETKADPAVWRAITALLDTPFASAEQRAVLWSAGHDLGQRLAGATPAEVSLRSGPDELAAADHAVALRRDLARRAAEAVGLLKLAGLGAEKAAGYDTEVGRLAKASKGDRSAAAPQGGTEWPELGARLHHAWAELIDSMNHGDLAARCRLVRVLPGAIGVPAIDLGLDDPVAEIRRRKKDALQAWLADWFRYVGTDRGLDFFLVAAQEYRRGLKNASSRPAVRITGPAQPITLGESEGPAPRAQTLDLAIELEAGTVKPAALAKGVSTPGPRIEVRVNQPVPGWLDVSLDRSERADRTAEDRISSEPGTGRLVINPGESGSTIPLRLRLKARDPGGGPRPAPRPQASPPAGILVEAEVQGRVFSRPVPVVVRSAADAFQVILGDGLQDQPGARAVMRLRPLGVRQPVPLSVRNPTASPREVIVELRLGPHSSNPVVMSSRMTVGAHATQPVAFAAAMPRGVATDPGAAAGSAARSRTSAGPSPATPLNELEGPLNLTVFDAQRPEAVLGQRLVAVEVAKPSDYVRVQEAWLTPPRPVANEPNRLSVTLRSMLPPSDPATTIELVLRPDRIPGLVGVEKGVLQGKLPAGGELTVSAEAINLDPSISGQGIVEVTVDGVERALLLRTAFTSNGDGSRAVIDQAVALRLRSPAMARTGTPVPVVLEVDNGPEDGSLELSLGRRQVGQFEPIQFWRYRGVRRSRVGVDPSGPGGVLLFDASLADWSQVLDTGGLRGRFPLRARLRRGDGLIIKEVQREILLDDQRPRWINLVGVPRQAKRGRTLEVTAVGDAPPSGIASALFFVGKPDSDGKVAPGTVVVPGTRQEGKTERWKAALKLPVNKADTEAMVSVRFITGVGLEAVDTAAIELADTDPITTGAVRGVVREGALAQKDLLVGLFDSKGNKLREVRTSETGSFLFDDVPPGIYFLTSARPVAATSGQAKAEVKAEQTTEVAIPLFRQ